VRELAGKTAVVTGAASGIGRSLARRWAAEGMRVVLADVEEGALSTAVGELGGDVIGMATDVTSREQVEDLAAMAYGTFGSVDVLCNNAGVFQGGLLWECTDEDFQWTLGVNLWGILNGIRAFVPRMLAAGTEGHVVNTVSMAGLATTPFSGPYNVSKFAAVCPGLVDTAISRSRRNRPAALVTEQSEGAAFVEQALSDGTAGSMSPDDVADLVVEAVREERFLVPTRPSYTQQLTDRCEDLVSRRAPRSPTFD
jgi:NAD(P)-dependent dehydrogenase (short-subunit alcohol dehydrogenase family)